MFAGMTLGVGDDYAIHFVERYRRARAGPAAPGPALAATLESTGTAIVIDALAVACAFGALAMSEVPANARLGLIAAMTILACLVATLLLIPALLALYSRCFRDN
jgi:predicted RND superfamily exporter protein